MGVGAWVAAGPGGRQGLDRRGLGWGCPHCRLLALLAAVNARPAPGMPWPMALRAAHVPYHGTAVCGQPLRAGIRAWSVHSAAALRHWGLHRLRACTG